MRKWLVVKMPNSVKKHIRRSLLGLWRLMQEVVGLHIRTPPLEADLIPFE